MDSACSDYTWLFLDLARVVVGVSVAAHRRRDHRSGTRGCVGRDALRPLLSVLFLLRSLRHPSQFLPMVGQRRMDGREPRALPRLEFCFATPVGECAVPRWA